MRKRLYFIYFVNLKSVRKRLKISEEKAKPVRKILYYGCKETKDCTLYTLYYGCAAKIVQIIPVRKRSFPGCPGCSG